VPNIDPMRSAWSTRRWS